MELLLNNSFLIAQIFGALAFCLQILAWQLKSPRLIIFIHAPINFVWSMQFYLLGAFVGLFQAMACGIKDIFLSWVNVKYVFPIVTIYLTSCFVTATFFFNVWYDTLPFLGTFIINMAYLKRDNRKLISRGYIGSIICWMIYNYFSAAYVTMACDGVVGIAIIISMIRHEKWEIGRCYRTFLPSIHRALFDFTPRTYP